MRDGFTLGTLERSIRMVTSTLQAELKVQEIDCRDVLQLTS